MKLAKFILRMLKTVFGKRPTITLDYSSSLKPVYEGLTEAGYTIHHKTGLPSFIIDANGEMKSVMLKYEDIYNTDPTKK